MLRENLCPLCSSTDHFIIQETAPLSPEDPLAESTLTNSGEVVRFHACRQCTLIFRSPRPTPSHLAHYYEKILPGLEPGIMATMGVTREQADLRNERRYDRLFDLLRPMHGDGVGHIVDIGGWDGRALVPWLRAGWRTTLIEPGARERTVANADILAAESARDALEVHGKADVLTSYHCVEHLLNIKTWLDDARLLSRPGTLWVVEVPFELIYIRGFTSRRPLQRAGVHPEHFNFFTPTSLKWLARCAGLESPRIAIVITPYWFGPTVSLRLCARQGTEPSINVAPKLRNRRALRGKLAVSMPFWRRLAGLKYRYHRMLYPD